MSSKSSRAKRYDIQTIGTIPDEVGGGVITSSRPPFEIPPGLVADIRDLTDEEVTAAAGLYYAIVKDYHFHKARKRHIATRRDVTSTYQQRGLEDAARCFRTLRLLERDDDDFVHFIASRFLPLSSRQGILDFRARLALIVEAADELVDARRRAEEARADERARRLASRRRPLEEPAPPVCAHDGCVRTRAFFDEAGVGYCKRHGAERGLRPHGKI